MKHLTDEQLATLSSPIPERISAALENRDPESAKALCDEFHGEWVLLHDIFLDWTAAMLSYVGEKHSQEQLREATVWSVAQYLRPLYDAETTAPRLDERERTDAATETFVATKESGDRQKLVQWTNIWHAHYSRFAKIEERDDCFLLHQDPCGSGGRLLRSGAYELPKNFHLVPHMRFSTGEEKDFPVYCFHCFAGIEGNLELTGKAVFLVDRPPREKSDVCIFRIPKETPSRERLFAEAELRALCRPRMAMAKDAIDRGEISQAREFVHDWSSDCLALHDVYRNWSTALLTFIYERWGYEELVEALRRSIRPWVFGRVAAPALDTLHRQLASDGSVARVRNLSRILRSDHGSFDVAEDDEKFTFIYECGSGGRLIKEGAYGERGWARLKEATPLTRGIKDYPIYCAACKAVTDTLSVGLDRLPIVVDHEGGPPGCPCRIYVYKDGARVPEKFETLVTQELTREAV
jgi:hypothetical protein